MKRFILMLSALMVLSFSSFAQQEEDNSESVGSELAEEMGLAGEQKEKFTALLTERSEEIKALNTQSNGQRNGLRQTKGSAAGQQKRDEIQKIQQKFDGKIEELLTEEQFTRYKKILEDRRAERNKSNN